MNWTRAMNSAAPRLDLSDAVARSAALDPNRSFIVEAAAGSGKTSLLTQRFLGLLARVTHPESVVAITFTRKAAAEMRSRVLAALALADAADTRDPLQAQLQILARAVVALDREHGWRLRENPARLRIQTIDALTAGLVRRLPLTAGLPSGYAVRDDALELYRSAARRTLLEAEGSNTAWCAALSDLLDHLDNDWRRAESLLIEMLARRDQWLARIVQPPSHVELQRALAALVAIDLADLVARCPSQLRVPLLEFARAAGRNMQTREGSSARVALADFTVTAADGAAWRALADVVLTQSGTPRRKLDKNTGLPSAAPEATLFRAQHADILAALEAHPAWVAQLHTARRLPFEGYSASQFALIDALFSTLTIASAHWRVVCSEHGQTDFAELSLAALAALGEIDAPSDLSLALDYQLQHLLVDEFQDTSRVQYALFERLTAGWAPDDGRTLFLVGDPQQSIYRFRDADVSLFKTTLEAGQFGTIALARLQLTTNFRASVGVIEWFNRYFPQIFPTSSIFTRSPQAAADGGVYWHSVAASTRIAQMIEVINDLRRRSPLASIAVLVRSRSHLRELPRALLAAGIPVHATDISPLHETAVINDLMALTRALYALTDRTAWLAVLRAPWCGMELGDLQRLFGHEAERLVWEVLSDDARLAAISVPERTRLLRVRAILATALAVRGRLAYAELVAHTWHALRGPLAAMEVAAPALATRYFELLAALEADGRELTQTVLESTLARHFAPVPTPPGPAVQLMTIHHAKGLEFDAVLLPELERAVRLESRALLLGHAAASAATGVLAPLPTTGGGAEPIYDFLRAREHAEMRAEGFRLLYVAMTRARRELHLFAIPPTARAARQGTFLAMLWPLVAALPVALNAVEEAEVPFPLTAKRGRRRLRESLLPMLCTSPLPATDSATALEFAWASPVAKHIGTVTHQLLEAAATRVPLPDSPPVRAVIEARLRARGIVGTALVGATEEVREAVQNTLRSTRGRWLFSAQHAACKSEYRLTAQVAGGVVDVVIDRTFIDSDGVRWIVDFKTGAHLGGDPAAFMAREVLRYRPQLEHYAEVMRALDSRPIRLGLYFPRLDGWREWASGEDPDQLS